MRNLKLYFSILGCAAMLSTSCTKLETKETDSEIRVSASGFVAGDPAKLLTSAYSKLDVFADQANIYSLGQHTTAQMIPPTRGTDWGDNGVWRTLDQHTWDATHSFVLNSWNQLNERSYNMNEILASNPSAAQTAEAKFLRALYMFHVMDYFGQVPIRDVNQKVGETPTVMSRAEAFDFIEKDLLAALTGLSGGGPKAENPTATKAAANFLLAKLYLNKAVYKGTNPAGPYNFDAADMAKVIAACDAITAEGYGLESSYFKNFSKDASMESIFTLSSGSTQNRYCMTLHYGQGGWNGFTTLSEFYDKFDKNDQRRGGSAAKGIGNGFLLGPQFDKDGKPVNNERTNEPLKYKADITLAGADSEMGIRVVKYNPETTGKYIMMRNGAAQMMKAEAQFRSGKNADALATVNALRAKRGMGAFTALTANDLFDELGRETYWEGGTRTDEVRYEKFLTGAGVAKRDAGTVLFPIPSNAVSTNSKLKQNAGY
jgi:hypothetical protein